MLVDLGLINFAMKTDTKFLFTPPRNMNKLFETTKKAAAIPDEPDALIQFHDRPCISYQETTSQQFVFTMSQTSLKRNTQQMSHWHVT